MAPVTNASFSGSCVTVPSDTYSCSISGDIVTFSTCPGVLYDIDYAYTDSGPSGYFEMYAMQSGQNQRIGDPVSSGNGVVSIHGAFRADNSGSCDINLYADFFSNDDGQYESLTITMFNVTAQQ